MGSDGQLRLVEVADIDPRDILVHDAHRHDPSLAFALARLNSDDDSPTPFGIFRDVDRPEYAHAVAEQVLEASETKGPGNIENLLRSNGTWTVD
jgi:2-oxoglutarate ferredoxin oxidoreductase subunit beta